MKTFKSLTVASLVPLLWISTAQAQEQATTHNKAELQKIEPCLEPAPLNQGPHNQIIPIDGCDDGGGGTGGGGTGGGGTGGGGTGGGIEPCLEPAPLVGKQLHGTKQNKIRPIDECDDGGGGSTGPYVPPGTPSSITSPVYTNDNNYRVSWQPGNGGGYSVRNELYVQTNNGGWSKVYDGYGSSKYFTESAGKKVKRHRVRSCNSKGCSSYRYSNKMIVNYKAKPNLYSKYSFLNTLDQKNNAYQASAQSFKTVLSRDTPAGQSSSAYSTTTNQDRFFLGDGYDLVRGALKETCLNVEHPDFEIVENPPLQPSTFGIDYVNNNRHLAELLEVSASAKVGFTGDDFSLGLSGEKERYVKSVSDEQHVRFVVKVKNRREFWKLNTPTNAIYPQLVNQVLSPNDDEAKADFRERCGDNFISSANLGSALYLVFMFDAKKYSYEEREAKKAELGLKIGDIFSANGAAGSSSSLKQTLDSLEVSINADQVGGPPGLAASITAANVMDKYNQFVQNTSESNWAAVDFATTNYQRPTVYNNYDHSEIFADYRGTQGILAQMRRWLDISVQHRERCDPWGEYGQSTPYQCGSSQAEIIIAMDTCRDTREWDNCKHPVTYNTGNISITVPGTNLLNWLNANVKKLNQESASEYYDHHVHKGSKQVNDLTCLSASSCFANKHRGFGAGIGKGFNVQTFEYDNPKGSGRKHNISPQYCVRSEAYLKTGRPPFGDTTADWRYRVNFEGVCPQTENFVIVQ